MKRKALAFAGLAVIFLLFVALMIGMGHAATTSTVKHNSIGFLPYQDNPYQYLAVDRVIGVANVDGNLSLRVHPLGTFMLFDQNLLICGLPIDKFQTVHGPFVMMYERQAHRMVQGIGCHNLIRVNGVTLPTEVQ